MPNFNKTEVELTTRLDKWLYFIKNLEDFKTIPTIFTEEKIFENAFKKAELAKYNSAESESYERSLMEYRDLKGFIDTAFDEGKMEGKMEGKIEIAISMKREGETIEKIIRYTGLTKEEIDKL